MVLCESAESKIKLNSDPIKQLGIMLQSSWLNLKSLHGERYYRQEMSKYIYGEEKNIVAKMQIFHSRDYRSFREIGSQLYLFLKNAISHRF